MAKEQSGRNTLLFLSECGRGVDILNLFRCLFGNLFWHAILWQFFSRQYGKKRHLKSMLIIDIVSEYCTLVYMNKCPLGMGQVRLMLLYTKLF